MTKPVQMSTHYTMYECVCAAGGLTPHKIDAIEDFETKEVLLLLLKCLKCEKETRLEFNHEKE